jgi:hypothetical protein
MSFIIIKINFKMDIQIRKFDPRTIDPCRICVFIGRRGSGKSCTVTDILYHQRKIPMGVVMSGTEESNEHYQQYVPDSFIYGKYEPDVIKKVISHQKKVVKKMSAKEKEDFSNPSRSVFILLDDCMFDNKWTRSEDMRCIFMNGRHYRIFLGLTIQYVMDLPPSLRGQCDYVFVFKENILENKQKLWKHLFGIFPTFDAFNEVFTQCTENYECLVLNVRSTSNKIEDVVFWYKAKPGRKFKIGSSQLWEHHRRNYNPKHDTPDDQNLKPKKKNTVSVNVVKTDSTGKLKKKNE